MQSIGAKIEEARKRKGISLREAAEATKIRSDFLSHIEKGKFDYDLPDIYKIGFIKNYAKYLKLNPERILSQYQEQLLSHSKNVKKTSADLFGANLNLDQATGDPLLNDLTPKPSYGKINVTPQSTQEEAGDANESPSTTSSNKDLYIKTGIVGIGTLLFVFSAIWLIQSIVNSNNEPTAIPSSNVTNQAQENASLTKEAYPLEEMTLRASGEVYVIVEQTNDKKFLLKQRLFKGEQETLKKRGPVKVYFTDGNHLTVFSSSLDTPARPKPDSKNKSIIIP